MPIYATQRNATNNQSTVDYSLENIFLYGNRYQEGVFVNNLGESLDAKDGILVVRNAGTYETATVEFADLANGETVILAGLTYTASGATTAATVAAAFANLAAGATGSGALSGTLANYSTGAVQETDKVVFTATTVGNKTNLAATGTGSVTGITIVDGSAGTEDGFSPATSANLANVIGVLKLESTTLADGETKNAYYSTCGDIDTGLLILPIGVSLSSIVGYKSLKDVLTGLGFVLRGVTENSKFDN